MNHHFFAKISIKFQHDSINQKNVIRKTTTGGGKFTPPPPMHNRVKGNHLLYK